MRYSLSVFDQKNILPVLLVVNTDGFSSKQFREGNFVKRDNEPYYVLSSPFWAKQVRIYNSDSIASHLQTPMEKMTALVHFLTRQQKHIIALDEYMNPTLQRIYTMAHQIFTEKSNDKPNTRKLLKITSSNNAVSRKRIAKYAQDGINFAASFKRRCTEEESGCVTPIHITKTKDLLFVEKFMEQYKGKMKWTTCFEEGVKEAQPKSCLSEKKKTTSMSDCYFRYFRYFYAIKHCWHLQSNTLHSQHSVNTRKKMNEQDTIIMIIFLIRRCEPAKGQRLLCPFVRFMR
ncbi:hypothetical protein AB4K20DRAFT_1977099 [Rhizopus microsporus]|uniref:Uncharacterized protein n=1 Tax=Rhizopus microsporus TaxID=58291 RepID=A0A1X0SH18_RHIZD|nr:hypothetical protein BCV71DRAFT_269640 [Rhizopus microsporus]